MKSGVYMIRHAASGRVYVGSSVDVASRWRQHRRDLCGGRHHSRFLQRAWIKHGSEAFEWLVVEPCGHQLLLERETHWIAHYRSAESAHGFNTCRIAGNTLGVRRTHEAIEKIRAAKLNLSAETRARLSLARRSRPAASEETREKMRRAAQRPRGPKPDGVKEKIRASLLGRRRDPEAVKKCAALASTPERRLEASRLTRARWAQPEFAAKLQKPVVCLDTGVKYPSCKAAAEAAGVSRGYLSNHLHGKAAACKGLRFALVDASNPTTHQQT